MTARLRGVVILEVIDYWPQSGQARVKIFWIANKLMMIALFVLLSTA
jgi:hypothetical protein